MKQHKTMKLKEIGLDIAQMEKRGLFIRRPRAMHYDWMRVSFGMSHQLSL